MPWRELFRPRNLALGAIFIFLIAIIGTYLDNQSRSETKAKRQRFITATAEGRQLFLKNSPESILLFKEALTNAQSDQEKDQARINIASAQLLSSPNLGIKALKEVTLDTKVSPFYRANAANFILDYYFNVRDVEIARKEIFTGDLWGQFIVSGEEKQTATEASVKKAYEWSISIYPTFIAEYRIASWYARWLKRGLTPGQQITYTEALNKHIDNGDMLLQRDGWRYQKNQIGLGYIVKGMALEGVYFTQNIQFDAILDAYRRALDILTSTAEYDYRSKELLAYANFRFASFLSRANGVKYKAEIRETLAGNVNLPSIILSNILRRAESTPADPIHGDAIDLARVDSNFKNILLNLGWDESSFK